jgi:dTDP-4-dehydrorhamnose 3,5-epimerase
MIADVEVRKLKVIPGTRGYNVEILRGDEENLPEPRHLYCSAVYPGEIKAWHYHEETWETVVCLMGMVKLVLYDDREGSPSRGKLAEFFIGEDNYTLVRIPPGLLHGVKCYGGKQAFLLILKDRPFNPERPDKVVLSPFSERVPYNWEIKMH